MKSSSTPAESGGNSTNTSAPKACPVCGSAEAWHGVITEPGEDERFACDECGLVRTVRIIKPEPPKPPRARRPFGLSVAIESGQLFLDVNGEAVVSFRPGYYLTIGNITIHGRREENRLQDLWTKVGAYLEANS